MKLSILGRFCTLASLMVLSAQAQVLLNADFDSASPFCCSNATTVSHAGEAVAVAGASVDLGSPHGNSFRVTVDSSQALHPWSATFSFFPLPGAMPAVNYDPAHTFVRFDVLVSKPRPLHVHLEYNATGIRNLDLDVNPAAADAFQTFLVRLSDFTDTIIFGTAFAPVPTCFGFRIQGDPADPDTTWPSAADDVFTVDNLSYVVQPPLDIRAAPGNVILTWPTNTPAFVLQQTPDMVNWTEITNTPVLSNGVNQVVLLPEHTYQLFRLISQ